MGWGKITARDQHFVVHIEYKGRNRRQAYANDLSFKDHLIAVDDHENGTVKAMT